MIKRPILLLLALLAVNIVSAVAVVQTKHQTRELYHSLQAERQTRDQLATEWAQIQLEDSAWASPDRVSQVARQELDMIQPADYIVLGAR